MDTKDQSASTSPSSNMLAEMRTALALDRTLLACVRTGLCLIGFGFTLAKFVYSLIEKGAVVGVQPSVPRHLGFTLMGLGVVTLFGGALQYFRMSKLLPNAGTRWSISFLVCVALTLLSIIFIVGLLFDLKTI